MGLFFCAAVALVSTAAEFAAPFESEQSMNHLAVDQIRHSQKLLDGRNCGAPSPAEQGCEVIRDQSYKFSFPFTSTDDFMRVVKESGGMAKFRKRFGLAPPSREQLKGPNADLPTGFTYNSDRSKIHMNCFLCHAARVNGETIEGAANGNLRFAELHAAMKDKPFVANSFRLASGEVGIPGMPGASTSIDISLFTSATRDAKGDLNVPGALGAVAKGMAGFGSKQIPVYAPSWWNDGPGLRKASFYSTGVANQSIGHIMQFAMTSDRTGDQLRKLGPVFRKMLACVKNVKPPPNGLVTDAAKVAEGREIYHGGTSPDRNCNCALCHGTTERNRAYDYPEKSIRLSFVQTDPEVNRRIANESEIEHHMKVVKSVDPEASSSGIYTPGDIGYVAPPLVALFARPALLHNHSVPTARDLLCKKAGDRPKRWAADKSRGNAFNDGDVAREPSGTTPERPVYDTSRKGFSNQGHDFCGQLKDDPKACDSLLEYLKTL